MWRHLEALSLRDDLPSGTPFLTAASALAEASDALVKLADAAE